MQSVLVKSARLTLAFLLSVAVGLGLLAVQPTTAAAASGDEIASFDITYDVQPSGVVKVTEKIDYRFGSSGRHGIDRILITRQPDGNTDNDVVYGIDNIEVSSPTGAPDEFTTRTSSSKEGRQNQVRIRIGDPDQTLSSTAETYLISYDLTGAMRSQQSFDEFYWNATGHAWDASIDNVSITATVPGGAQQVTCFAGAAGSKDTCEGTVGSGGVATFTASGLGEREGVTIGVMIKSGLITDNKPHLEPDASRKTPQERLLIAVGAGVAGLIVIASPLLGWRWWRKNGRDERYTNLAPGTVPLAGAPVQVGYNDPDIEIPVAFSPPRIPVAEAGMLIDGQVDTRETAATIIDLAVRGALTVQSEGADDFRVTLVNPNLATAPHEMVLMTNLFNGRPPGATEDLSAQGSMLDAHTAMVASVRSQVTSRGWFRKVPSASAVGGLGFGAMAFAVFMLFQLGSQALLFVAALLPVAITLIVLKVKLRRGQRTPEGRAVCDQVEGFKKYLATAEADQLRFEEGEDIFSKYLPWAISFDLADRWAKICGDLVRMGRIPDQTPYWFYGNYHMSAFNVGFLTSTLTTAATAVPTTSSSSGSSSFGGGGFSGGGGGGGGGGSW